MNLRRISISVPAPERLIVPRPGGTCRPDKTVSIFNRSDRGQLGVVPIRLTPKPSSSANGTQNNHVPSIRVFKPSEKFAVPGPSRQLIPSTPSHTSDGLDGISVLPLSTNRTLRRRPDSKKKEVEVSSQVNSKIPCRFGFKAPPSKKSATKPTFTAKRRSRTPQSNIIASHPRLQSIAHPRLQAVADLSSPASPHSGNSTDQFEEDEIAAALPTPARSHQQASETCQYNCSKALLEMQKVKKELLMSHKQFLVKQTENFEKQNKLIEKQTEHLEKQTEVLCKLLSLLDKDNKVFNNHSISNESDVNDKENSEVRPKPKKRRSVSNHRASNGDKSSDNEMEPTKRRSKGNAIKHQAESQYNNIRSEFGCLRLKTPKKVVDGRVSVTPKTPKSILSRTLQLQLGDIFEET